MPLSLTLQAIYWQADNSSARVARHRLDLTQRIRLPDPAERPSITGWPSGMVLLDPTWERDQIASSMSSRLTPRDVCMPEELFQTSVVRPQIKSLCGTEPPGLL